MNIIKKIAIGIFAALLLLVLISFLLPSRIRVARTTVIKAPPEKIYESVATPRTWKEWTAWNSTKYPKMKWDYKGPETGVGAESFWTDPGGDGHMKLTKADPKEGVEYDLTFADFPTIPGSIKLVPEGDATKVTWFFEQDTGWNPVYRYFCNFMMDSLIGADFEAGLAGLKKRVEAAPPTVEPSAPPSSAEKPSPSENPPASETPPAKSE